MSTAAAPGAVLSLLLETIAAKAVAAGQPDIGRLAREGLALSRALHEPGMTLAPDIITQ